jgi:hypothetical protein
VTRPHGTALGVTILIGENDAFHHRPLSGKAGRRAESTK